MLNFCKKLYYHTLEFTITPREKVKISGWVGAVLRNNFLYACEQISLGEGKTLLAAIQHYPLESYPEHPLYKHLSGGFPRCFALLLEPHYAVPDREVSLREGDAFRFSLVLLGEASNHYRECIQAVKYMCDRGIGHPMIPFEFVQAVEKVPWGRDHKIAIGEAPQMDILRYPVRLSDFQQERFGERDICISLEYSTPVWLTAPGTRKNSEISYQDKLNGFPGFYQFIRSAAFRCITLTALYAAPDDFAGYEEAKAALADFTKNASEALLLQIELKYYSFPGSKRNGEKEQIVFKGYVGHSVYGGDFTEYIPFLHFMEGMGTGNDTAYGLGNFKIEVINTK